MIAVRVIDDAVRKRVEAEVAAERAQVEERIASLEARDKVAVKEATRASAKFHKLADKSKDMALTKRDGGTKVATPLGLAQRNLDAAMGAVEGLGRALASERSKLALLTEVEVEERLKGITMGGSSPRSNQGGGTSRRMAEKAEVSKEVIDFIKQGVKDGKGAPKIATELNAAGHKNQTGGQWNHGQVRAALRASGVEWNDLRSQHKAPPRERKAASTPAPRKTGSAKSSGAARKTASSKTASVTSNGNGNGKAKPIDKKAQASGTSRGGTGSKKKTSSARRGGKSSASK